MGSVKYVVKRRVQGDLIVVFTFPNSFRYVEDGYGLFLAVPENEIRNNGFII